MVCAKMGIKAPVQVRVACRERYAKETAKRVAILIIGNP
jgi:hypothetical protein